MKVFACLFALALCAFASPMIAPMDKDGCCDDLGVATCKSLGQGVCRACKNCRYCVHCSKGGGKCSVCAKEGDK